MPISLAYHKAKVQAIRDKDEKPPLLLDGYGAYEICNDPYFTTKYLPLLNRGWIIAFAHVRGGGEMGRHWYENGK